MFARLRTAFVVLPALLLTTSCGDSNTPTGPIREPVSIETESLTEAIEGQAYNQHLEATGGSGSYSWVLAAGSLPSGLTLAPAGAISGTPAAPGTSSFRVRATDTAGQVATADLSISVIQTLAVHSTTLPDGVAGEDYVASLQAVGGRGGYTWRVTGGDAATWLTVSDTGVLTGIATAAGASNVTVAVTDESVQEATRELDLLVLDPLAVAPIDLPAATQGRDYAAQLVATGGDGAYAWSVESGALPTGMVLAGGGALTGTPQDGGTFTFNVQVTDGADRVATRSLSITVQRAPTIQTTGLSPAVLGEPYTAQLTATGGSGSYTWTVITGSLPDGLTLSTSGLVSGTPTTEGGASFTVQVVDDASAVHTRGFTIVVAAEIGELVSHVPITGLAGEAGSVRYYTIDVPPGTTQLSISISGGTGDVDLYVRHDALPQEFVYDCRPLRQGNEETCVRTYPDIGRWYVMLRGYIAYADVTLVAAISLD